MQKKIRDHLVCRCCKVEVLMNYWEKIEFKIMTEAAPNSLKGKRLDVGAQELAMKLHRVPQEIRHAVLHAFVHRCRQLHQIAFFQWRLMFRHDRTKVHELEAALQSQLAALRAVNAANGEVRMAADLVEGMGLPSASFVEQYGLRDARNLDFLINDFADVGWSDPFAGEEE